MKFIPLICKEMDRVKEYENWDFSNFLKFERHWIVIQFFLGTLNQRVEHLKTSSFRRIESFDARCILYSNVLRKKKEIFG